MTKLSTLLSIILVVLAGLAAEPASARNTRYALKISDVQNDPRYAPNVPSDVAFYFAGQSHPTPTKTFGQFVTNRKGNSVGRPDEDACRWTMISALKQLHDRALEEGGNAVINIVSYYRQQVFSSDTLYECHAGAVIAAVALRGDVVTLPK
jgi:hypothetical protein